MRSPMSRRHLAQAPKLSLAGEDDRAARAAGPSGGLSSRCRCMPTQFLTLKASHKVE